jgi:hypothetical protein
MACGPSLLLITYDARAKEEDRVFKTLARSAFHV